MKRTLAILTVVPIILLTGCAAAPSRDEIADRFLLEVTDSAEIRDGLADFGLSIADDALDGMCGSAAYETGLAKNGDANLLYAWRTTCLAYFESDLTQSQIDETKAMIAERALG